jgi:uncharacterized repeat protein (TIGR03803 family)
MHRLTAAFGNSAFGLILAFGSLGSQTANAQTYTVLHYFSGGADGAGPVAGLTPDGSGGFYGTTFGWGQDYEGTVYQLKQTNGNWVVRTIASGLDFPEGRVVFGPRGNLYGTTSSSGPYGPGGVYRLLHACGNPNCPWTLSTIYLFSGTTLGAVDPVFDQAGNLYGTTRSGGSGENGSIFKLTPPADGGLGRWTETDLYSFTGGSDGRWPWSGVIFDAAGNLYGTTQFGGDSDLGTVYELSPSGSGWILNTIYSFHGGDDGQQPDGGLIFDRFGHLYGTTAGAGVAGGGTVFELTPNGAGWSFSVLYGLSGPLNNGPQAALTMDAAGNLYGTTENGGTHSFGSVFELMSMNTGWVYTDLYDFRYPPAGIRSKGLFPNGSVTLDANGNLYGTAAIGGITNGDCLPGCGVVWEITPYFRTR